MKKKRFLVSLDEKEYEYLRTMSFIQKKSMAEIVREALKNYLYSEKHRPDFKKLKFVSSGRSGYEDTSLRHDEILGEEEW